MKTNEIYIDKYKKEGWFLLHKNKGGGLGSVRKIIKNEN